MTGSRVKLPWGIVILLCATIGLAPFNPPHIIEKISLLRSGALTKPLDWLDLALHGAPWLLLAGKIVAALAKGAASPSGGR